MGRFAEVHSGFFFLKSISLEGWVSFWKWEGQPEEAECPPWPEWLGGTLNKEHQHSCLSAGQSFRSRFHFSHQKRQIIPNFNYLYWLFGEHCIWGCTACTEWQLKASELDLSLNCTHRPLPQLYSDTESSDLLTDAKGSCAKAGNLPGSRSASSIELPLQCSSLTLFLGSSPLPSICLHPQQDSLLAWLYYSKVGCCGVAGRG